MDLDAFASERVRLTLLAERILGASADADDVVQEALLKFSQAHDVNDPPAWLTTVVTRRCLDVLRSRAVRTSYERKLEAPEAVDPEADAVTAERVAGAMNVVMQTLAPAERAAFVLHDVFGYGFTEVGAILGRSDEAARQLASRARRKARGLPGSPEETRAEAEHAAVVTSFIAAAHGGDLAALLALLAPEVSMRTDQAGQKLGADSVYSGPEAVAARFNNSRGASVVVVDGQISAAWLVKGIPRAVFIFDVQQGVIRGIELIADPESIAMMDVETSGE